MLEADETYWGGAPKVKTLIFEAHPRGIDARGRLLRGQVDVARRAAQPGEAGRGQCPDARGQSALALNIHIVLDTLIEEPLRDVRVRQAINYGVDKDAIIKSVLEGNGSALGGPLTPVMFGYDAQVKPYPYDPERAKRLLADAGQRRGSALTLNSPNGR